MAEKLHSINGPTTDQSSAPTDLTDASTPSFVVGVGASAGGLEALEALFDSIPPDTDMAFVVVQHLSPDFKSMMDRLLGRHTKMPIYSVEDGMTVEPNSVYLIPPKTEMIISGNRLLLTEKDPTAGLSLPIDIFFRSLASDWEESSIAIVLSGTGTDGSRGVRAINNAGGLVLVQTAESAQFDGMPRAAVDTGCADLVTTPQEMGPALVRFANVSTTSHDVENSQLPDPMLRVFALLQDRFNIDFSRYKTNTVSRRIQRRLELLHDQELPTYVSRLEQDPQEQESLYRDLLIGVTSFFRDKEAYERLETKTIPDLFDRHHPTDEIRVWVAACATGEEAYSMAILLYEAAKQRKWLGAIKIFATDVHRSSIETAGLGLYSTEQLAGVSKERLKRWFTEKEGRHQIAPAIRQSVVFAPHNLLRDAPFTKLDLITCRNMLIYLRTDAQKKVLAIFHFALQSGGILWLGPSESPGELGDEFETLDSRWKVYRKRRDVSLLADIRLTAPTTPLSKATSLVSPQSSASRTRLSERQVVAAYESLAEEHLPPSLVVNDRIELVYTTAGASQYLNKVEGFAQTGLLELVDRELRSALLSLIQRSNREKRPLTYDSLTIPTEAGPKLVDIRVKPATLPNQEGEFLLVSFYEQRPAGELPALPASPPDEAHIGANEALREHIEMVERELRSTKENLQATIQELETSNEELQASNEELVASNEELQSTNEELHSVNEELHTVNTEHQRQIELLTELTEDMDNLLTATDAATLFLDDQLCIRRISPGALRIFNVLETDLGRHLNTFNHTLKYPALISDLELVISDGKSFEKEVVDIKGTHYLVRLSPYKSRVGVTGVVVSLIDFSVSHEARRELEQSEHRFRGTFENAAVGIAHVNLDGSWLDVNERLCEIVGYTKQELLGSTFQDITHRDDLDSDLEQLDQLIKGEIDSYSMEKRYVRKDGSEVWINLTVSLNCDDKGEPLYCISIIKDESKRNQFERELKKAVTQRDRFLATLSHELRNPLAALLHAARLMVRKFQTAETEKPLNVVIRQAEQMSRLLDDLLDLARVTQDKIMLEYRPLDIRQVVREACDAVQPQMDAKSHEFVVDLPEEQVWVDGDQSRLIQVVDNLLTNATKYTADGGKIHLELLQEAGWATIRICDTGCGLSGEMIATVFEMFVQSDRNQQRRDGGMGIGLTLVKSLVEMQGGVVAAESEGEGRGSTFTVRLPLTDKRPSDDQQSEEAHQATTQRRNHVVLVEDEHDARVMLAETLELDGYEVTAVGDGDQGLAAILRERPDVALVDIALPGMSGFQIARQVRKTLGNDQVYLVALTGYGRKSDRQKALEAGFDEHLVKPVHPDQLERVLSKPVD